MKSKIQAIWPRLQKPLSETEIHLNAIAKEVERAEKLYPVWPENLHEQNGNVQEEAGEVTKAVNDWRWKGKPLEDIETELIHTGAMCVRMLKNIRVKR